MARGTLLAGGSLRCFYASDTLYNLQRHVETWCPTRESKQLALADQSEPGKHLQAQLRESELTRKVLGDPNLGGLEIISGFCWYLVRKFTRDPFEPSTSF